MTAIQTTGAQDSARQIIAHAMKPYAKALANVLPKHITPERVLSLTLVAAVKNPKIAECTPESIALSLLRAAQWGLEIGTTVHLVPFYTQGEMVLTPIPDWKGLVEMALRSPHVRDVWATAVYEGETFRVTAGVDPTIYHEPVYTDDVRRPTHYYAVAILRGNRSTFEVMSAGQVDRIRQAAKSKDSPAWKNHLAEMGKKTVLRRLLKRLPQLSVVMRDAVDAEDVTAYAPQTATAHIVADAPAFPRESGRPPMITAGEYDGSAQTAEEPIIADEEMIAAMGEAFKKHAATSNDPYTGEAPEGLALGDAPVVRTRRSPQEQGR